MLFTVQYWLKHLVDNKRLLKEGKSRRVRYHLPTAAAKSVSEIDEARAGSMARFDINQDGKLSLKEYEALWLEKMRARMVDGFQRLDQDGDATVTAEEFAMPSLTVMLKMRSTVLGLSD